MKEKLDIIKELLGNRAKVSDFELNTKIHEDAELYQFSIKLDSGMYYTTLYYYRQEHAFMSVIKGIKAYVSTADKHNV